MSGSGDKLSLDLNAEEEEDGEDYGFALSPPRTPPLVKFSDMDVEDDTIDASAHSSFKSEAPTTSSPRGQVSRDESEDEGFLTRGSGTNFKLPKDVTRTPPESPVRRAPPSLDKPLSVTFPSTPNNGSAPVSPSTPAKRVIVLSDMVALNHMPSVRNPAKLTQELELSDMWEIIGSAFVKHNGIRSLLLELASPLHLKDLPLLTRWAQAKLQNDEVVATWATQAQIFEMNALKKQSRRRHQDRRRTRPRVYKTPEPRLSMPGSRGKNSRPRVPPAPHLTLPRSKSRSKRSKRRQKANRVNRAQRMMPIKCLFLDIEGVLTAQSEGPSTLPRSIRKITPKLAEKLLMLKLVVYLTRCKLICTCSLKKNHQLIETVNVIFKAWGIMPFYSVTAGLPDDHDGPLRLLPSNRRAKEVGHWLRTRNVKTWCVVDTMDLSVLDDECDRTVMVDGLQGMSRDDCKQILDILGVEPELYH